MHTLFDFLTRIKGIEYIASISFIAGYLFFLEFLKPKPFSSLVQAGREDIEHLRTAEPGQIFKTVRRVIAAPFIGLAYICILPFGFIFALFSTVLGGALRMAGKEAFFGWRLSEAYLSGKKEKAKDSGKK